MTADCGSGATTNAEAKNNSSEQLFSRLHPFPAQWDPKLGIHVT